MRRLAGGRLELRAPLAALRCTNVCFWYVPRRMRPLPPSAELTAAHPVHGVAAGIKAKLQQEGGDELIQRYTSETEKVRKMSWSAATWPPLPGTEVPVPPPDPYKVRAMELRRKKKEEEEEGWEEKR